MKNFRCRAGALVLCALLTAPYSVAAQDVFQYDGPVMGPTRSTTVPSVPATLGSGVTFTSACLPSNRARAFDAFADLSAVATLQVQRYVDLNCKYPAGAAVPATALTLTTGGLCLNSGSDFCGDVASNDGMPFQAVKIAVHNTSGGTNIVGAVQLNQAAE